MRYTLATLFALLPAAIARAELTPDEVAVIAMAQSEQSCHLADYYAQARGIDPSHIFLLDGEPGGTMTRETWQEQAQPAIRTWLDEIDADERIRCLVTCWDVPLQIAARSPDAPVVVARTEFLSKYRGQCVAKFNEVIERLTRLGLDPPLPDPVRFDSEAEGEALAAHLNVVFREAQARVKSAESEELTKLANATFEQTISAASGIAGLLQAVSRNPAAASDPLKLELLKGRLHGLNEGLKAISGMPDSVTRDIQIMRVIPQMSGLMGTIKWIDDEQRLLRVNDTQASLDSELSLVHWPEYPLLNWQANLLHYRHDRFGDERLRTLMVARLEAPTYELAKMLIDTAIATEQTGLHGKVYLDARGMQPDPQSDGPDSHAAYDQSIRDLAERLRTHTELEVVLDDQATLFQEGACPDAALYCGWYSLAKYVDAFDWQPGAVGYHLAGAEAATLRTPGSQVWCNAMLEDGITATLGPTFEPNLASFPLPDEFFSLLLTGRYTLAEAYYRSKPRGSWAMVLVGDPLYNPFAKGPPLGEDALPERMQQPAAEETP